MKHLNKNINSFKTPENYFDNLSENVFAKISEEKIREIAGEKLPFTVPEDYFENLNGKITDKIKRTERIKKNPLYILKPFLAIAASLLLIFAFWQTILNKIDFSRQKNINAENAVYIPTENTSAKIFDEQIIDTDYYTVAEIISENSEKSTNLETDEETIQYIDDYTEYSEILALY